MNNKGVEGEQLFKAIMEKRNYKVIDTTNNPEYFDTDIDFILTSPTTGLTKKFEVKWDFKIHKTNNLYLEIASKYGNRKGYYNCCEADYLVYGDAINKKFYIFPLLELRERVDKMPKNYAQCGNDSIGYLVSLDSVKGLYKEL